MSLAHSQRVPVFIMRFQITIWFQNFTPISLFQHSSFFLNFSTEKNLRSIKQKKIFSTPLSHYQDTLIITDPFNLQIAIMGKKNEINNSMVFIWFLTSTVISVCRSSHQLWMQLPAVHEVHKMLGMVFTRCTSNFTEVCTCKVCHSCLGGVDN